MTARGGEFSRRSGSVLLMPSRHMRGVRSQVRAWLIELVIKLQVQMERLQIAPGYLSSPTSTLTARVTVSKTGEKDGPSLTISSNFSSGASALILNVIRMFL